jgi:arylsulfatase A-like enzyme
MKTRISVFTLVIILALAAIAGYLIVSKKNKALTQDPQKKYNVVMIVSDALRQDVVGCYGGIARTPNINWLAENGVLFENSYSTSPWTSPSSVSMLTGNYATSYEYSREGKTKKQLRVLDDGVQPRYTHIPQIYVPHGEFLLIESLKELGYVTEMKVENVNAMIHNNLQGFDSIPEFKSTLQVADSINRIARGGIFDSWEESTAYWYSFCVLRHLLDTGPGENFFTLHWILDPHYPYAPVEKFRSLIRVDESKLPVPKEYYWKSKYKMSECSPVELKFVRDLYVAEVESVDERVGFILAMLKHKNLMDSTYIVFTSDHGEQFGAHGLFGHGGHGKNCHYYEGLMRVPLIIAGPGLPKGAKIKNNVSLLGLMPTVKELLGVEYEDDVQGTSFIPLLSENDQTSGYLYFDDVQDHDQIDAVVEKNYKLIALKKGSHELYDVTIDPREEFNFASRNSELVESMYEEIIHMREENKTRRSKNLAALGDSLYLMPDDEREKVIKKLKSLGYID